MNSERKQSVLMVDDADSSRLLLRVLLSALGVEIIFEADNGARAVEKFKEQRPDLTLLDINMPVMGGHEALRLMLLENPGAHVVMLTAEGPTDAVDACLLAGARDSIRKDLAPDKLKTRLDVALQNAK